MNTTPVTRPGGLTALCILAIVLGALGVLIGLFGIAAAALQGPLQDLVAQMQPDGDEETAQLQQEIGDESREFAERHLIRNIVFAIARLFVAGGLFVGGILAFRLRKPGRKVLLLAFAAGIVFELCQIWPLIDAAQFTERIMNAQQLGGGPNADDDAQAMMRIMMKVIAAMQIVMMAAMALIKTAFYGFGWWYLSRPHIAALYIRPAIPDGEWR